ncbi:glycosyltransferase family 39 protein [Candidatus Roizmanbacteria bacterium]|nr:glycosyltransferase family 39 protein [Candidatus Roizmanbacteria bacterium]
MKTPIGIFLFIFSILLNLYSFLIHGHNDFLNTTQISFIATLIWIVSVLVFGFSIFVLYPDKNKLNLSDDFNLKEKILMTLIFTIALFLRLYKIDHQGLYLDEWYWLTNARSILDGKINSPFGFIGDQPSNMPAYFVAFLLLIVRDNYLAVRFASLSYSLLTILLLMYFLKDAFNKKIALISMLLISISVWDIHMSRIGWSNVNINPFLISGSIFFLYRGLKQYSKRSIFIAGVFLGISINLLYIASLGVIAAALYFLYHFFFDKKKRTILSLFFLFVLSTFIVSSPTFVKIYRYPRLSIQRHKNFFSENVTLSKNQGGIKYYIIQLQLALKDFNFSKAKYTIIGLWGITIEPIVIISMLIGILYILRFIYKPQHILMFLFFMIMFIPIVILNRFSSIWREYGFLPTIYGFAAIGANAIILKSSQLTDNVIFLFSKKRFAYLQKLYLTIFVVILMISFIYYFSRYYQNLLKNEPDIYETYCKKTARYISATFPKSTLILLPNELCNNLISAVLSKEYPTDQYESYNDIRKHSPKNVVIVRIADSGYTNKFIKQNPSPIFEENIKNFFMLNRRISITGNNDKIYAILYEGKVN